MLRRFFAAAALATLVGAPAVAQPAPGSPIDIGPAVGAHIPALETKDATGAARSYASVSGAKGTVLVFFRSARWCPFCQKQLIELKALQGPLAKRGYALAALSYDAPEALATFAQKEGVAYPLLSDEGSKTIDAFKLRDPQYAQVHFANGVPKPAVFVVDHRGVVKAKLALEGYKVRPDGDAILKAVDEVG